MNSRRQRDTEGDRCRAIVDRFFGRYRLVFWRGDYFRSKQSRQEYAQLLAETLWGPLTQTWNEGRNTGKFRWRDARDPVAYVKRSLRHLICDHLQERMFGAKTEALPDGARRRRKPGDAASTIPWVQRMAGPTDDTPQDGPSYFDKWGSGDDDGSHFGGGHPSDVILEKLNWAETKNEYWTRAVARIPPVEQFRDGILPRLKTDIERCVLNLKLRGVSQRRMFVPGADRNNVRNAVRKIQRIAQGFRPKWKPGALLAWWLVVVCRRPRPASPMILLAILKRWTRYYRRRLGKELRVVNVEWPKRYFTKTFDPITGNWKDNPRHPVICSAAVRVCPPGPGITARVPWRWYRRKLLW